VLVECIPDEHCWYVYVWSLREPAYSRTSARVSTTMNSMHRRLMSQSDARSSTNCSTLISKIFLIFEKLILCAVYFKWNASQRSHKILRQTNCCL